MAGLVLGCKSESPAKTEPEGAPTDDRSAADEAAPSPQPEASQPAEPKLPPAGAFVVIAADAPVYVAADQSGEPLPANSRGVDRTAKVLGVREGLIEVESLDASTLRACAGGFEFAEQARLRLFVRPDALRPVLTSPQTLSFEDGTEFELLPGVPVRGSGAEKAIAVGPNELRASIDEAKLGRWFDAVPSRASIIDALGMRSGITAGLALRYGEHGFVADDESFGIGSTEGKGSHLSFRNGCGRFLLRPDTSPDAPREGLYARKGEREHEPDPGVWGGLPLAPDTDDPSQADKPLCTLERWLVPARSELLWPDGSEAGELLSEHMLADEPDASQARACFELDGGVEVCVASSAVERRTNQTCARMLALARDEPPPDAPEPTVESGATTVTGALDEDIIRRIIKPHLVSVRACYKRGLAEQPELAGRVEIEFTIGATGKVTSSSVKSSTLADDEVSECIATAFERWTFPKARDGGQVKVVHSLDLAPG
ncbi:MAG: AgmX/PglI C-terminal domain-containing protein [Enhygromyxa sp.]